MHDRRIIDTYLGIGKKADPLLAVGLKKSVRCCFTRLTSGISCKRALAPLVAGSRGRYC